MKHTFRRIRHMTAPLVAVLLLAGCVGERAGGTLSVEIDSSGPTTALAMINEKAQKCWIRSGDRAFRSLAVIPELDTRTGTPRLLIVEKGKAAGLPKLVIDASGDPVKISTYGPLASAPVSTRINSDVLAWSNGRDSC